MNLLAVLEEDQRRVSLDLVARAQRLHRAVDVHDLDVLVVLVGLGHLGMVSRHQDTAMHMTWARTGARVLQWPHQGA